VRIPYIVKHCGQPGLGVRQGNYHCHDLNYSQLELASKLRGQLAVSQALPPIRQGPAPDHIMIWSIGYRFTTGPSGKRPEMLL
jgi:hypothetical protein